MSQNYKIVERLTDQADHVTRYADGDDTALPDTLAGACAQIAEVSTQAASIIQELGEALKPFVTQRDGSLCRLDHTKHFPDGTLAERAVTLGDIRRARAILSKLNEA